MPQNFINPKFFVGAGTGGRILPLALKKEEHERQSSNLPAENNTSVIASFQEKEENNLLPKG